MANPTITATNFNSSDKKIEIKTISERNENNTNVTVDKSRLILKVDITTMREAINSLYNYASQVKNCNCKDLERNNTQLCQKECSGGTNTLTITGCQKCQEAGTTSNCTCQKTKAGASMNQTCQKDCTGTICQKCQNLSYLKSECTNCVCDCNCNCDCSDSDSDHDSNEG